MDLKDFVLRGLQENNLKGLFFLEDFFFFSKAFNFQISVFSTFLYTWRDFVSSQWKLRSFQMTWLSFYNIVDLEKEEEWEWQQHNIWDRAERCRLKSCD